MKSIMQTMTTGLDFYINIQYFVKTISASLHIWSLEGRITHRHRKKIIGFIDLNRCEIA